MDGLILLGVGAFTIAFASVFYYILVGLKKQFRRYVLRFEEIKDRIE